MALTDDEMLDVWQAHLHADQETAYREMDAAIERILSGRNRISVSEIERALREADAPEDSMSTDEDQLRYEGRADAVGIVRDMLELNARWRTESAISSSKRVS